MLKRNFVRRVLVLTTAIIMLMSTACATNPVSKKSEFVLMSESQEFEIGRQMDPRIRHEYGVYPDGVLQAYVAKVGQRIAQVSDRPEIVFSFAVLDSPVVNAFALPGGYLYITRGLLAHINSEAELAGVLAHEVGHVTARHAVRQYTKAAGYQIGVGIASVFMPGISRYSQFSDLVYGAVSSGYSRQYENESDRIAVDYTLKAGYDPKAMTSMLKTLGLVDRYRQGQKSYVSLFATHPTAGKRIDEVEQELLGDMASPAGTLKVNRTRYLKSIDGLVFGNDPRHGLVKENRFLHPGLWIDVLFPRGWQIDNRPQAVVAKAPGDDFWMELRVHALEKKQPLAVAGRLIAQKIGLSEIFGSKRNLNGLQAYSGTYSGWGPNREALTARMCFFLQGDNLFCLTGIAEAADFSRALPFFDQAINSCRRLRPWDAENIRTRMVRIYTVNQGQNLVAILQKLGRPAGELETVALLNAWDPLDLPELKAGIEIKVIKDQ